jgi:hypothetical protein
VLGSAYPVCLSGAIGGRSFTLRVIIADPPSASRISAGTRRCRGASVPNQRRSTSGR